MDRKLTIGFLHSVIRKDEKLLLTELEKRKNLKIECPVALGADLDNCNKII